MVYASCQKVLYVEQNAKATHYECVDDVIYEKGFTKLYLKRLGSASPFDLEKGL